VGGAKHIVPENEGIVKVRDRGGVPGAASQRTRFEGVEVAGGVGDVGDDHFHDLVWEAAGRFVRGGRIAEQAIDIGFAST
jgi:hypothetical protein